MSKDRPGYLDEKTAAKCAALSCPLFLKAPQGGYATCSVRSMIDQERHSKSARQNAIGAYSSQVPVGCPAGYNS